MYEDSDDWKVIANELISCLIIHRKEETRVESDGDSSIISSPWNTIEIRASELIEYIGQADVPNELILPLINDLSCYSKRHLNGPNCHDTDSLYLCIHEYLSSLLIDEDCKINTIHFINLVVLSSDSTIGWRYSDEFFNEFFNEKQLEYAKLVMRKILICDSDDHRPSFSHYFHEKLQNFWDSMHASVLLSKGKKDDDRDHDDGMSVNSDTEAIITAGDFAAEKIYAGAKFISRSISSLLPKVTNGIEHVGEYAKQNITPSSSREDLSCNKGGESKDQEDQGVVVTKAMLEKSERFRTASQSVATGIRDIGTGSINKAAEKWEKNSVGKDLCPQDEIRESIVTAGKIGMAALGATVEISEAVFQVTKAVAQSSVKVTADVAQHAYGGNTKAVIENSVTATGNIIRGITHVTSLEGQVLRKTVLNETARVNTEEMVKTKSKEDIDSFWQNEAKEKN